MSSGAATPFLLSPVQVRDMARSSIPMAILDASWFMPNSLRNPEKEFLAKHIPSAQYLNLDEVASSHELGLKHMMPNEQVFAQACEKLGIEPSSHVIIYDTHGIFSSPRALFMFRTFGHEKSSIINGGLPRWILDGLPVESGKTEYKRTSYSPPTVNGYAVRDYNQIVYNSMLEPASNSEAELVLDARSRGRYLGVDPEPRPGLSSGHIPSSFSLPFNTFLKKHTAADGTEYTMFLPLDQLHEYVTQLIAGERTVITTCGSGMTAGVLWLGLQLLGINDVGLYDESWTGYAMRPSSKIEKS
ncbi:Rhodanese-like domain-containing protein [Cyathus striatus]|nr:Rhodanese-like domain-containing protein [Cyathus striatus]